MVQEASKPTPKSNQYKATQRGSRYGREKNIFYTEKTKKFTVNELIVNLPVLLREIFFGQFFKFFTDNRFMWLNGHL